jgi:stage II sporulation protein GA (sporulation sigma-E factor processing peptidase)
LLIGAGVSYAALTLLFRRRARHGLSERTAVEIVWQNRICRFTALRDSGHTLTDPFTGAPVVVADWDAAAPALPANVRGLLSKALLSDPVRAHETLAALTPRLRLLPYRAVGTESGFLLAFRPDSLRLDGKKLDRGLVALSPTPVSDGQDVSALISV